MNRNVDRPLTAARGYAIWASGYQAENAVTTLDRLTTNQLTPPLHGVRLLDAACGTGRRLPDVTPGGPTRAIGLDLVREMLRAGSLDGSTNPRVINANLTALPLPSASFDVVWCRLALGHLDDLHAAYAELHRVLDRDGCLIVTDFHPEAARAGHRRTFHDPPHGQRAVAFHAHAIETHLDVARTAGLEFDARRDACVGTEVRPFYQAAGKLSRYKRDVGLRLVFGLRFRRRVSR